METYIDEEGTERCDDCGDTTGDCACACVVCGDAVMDCACDEGPTYPAVSDY